MLPEIIQPSNYLMRMPDGTVKQMNPFTGTEVWTVPGRGHRPLGNHTHSGQHVDPAEHDAHCTLCARRVRSPSKAALFSCTQLSRNPNVHSKRVTRTRLHSIAGGLMADIFISYLREDIEAAEKLAEALQAYGWSVFWDRRIPAGKRFDDFLDEQLQGALCRRPLVAWVHKLALGQG